MKLIDLSQPLSDGCPHCPVHPRVEMRVIATHPGQGWHMEHVSMASHTGSHLDAPLHKIAGGKPIDAFPLESFVRQAWIADLRGVGPDHAIGAHDLQKALPSPVDGHLILLATGWQDRRAASEEWHFHSPFLSPEGARWLVDHRVAAVGIDHYSIGGSRDPENSMTHEILLGAGMWVVEDLCYPGDVFELPQPLEFWALPLNLPGFSGSPCRPVVLVR